MSKLTQEQKQLLEWKFFDDFGLINSFVDKIDERVLEISNNIQMSPEIIKFLKSLYGNVPPSIEKFMNDYFEKYKNDSLHCLFSTYAIYKEFEDLYNKWVENYKISDCDIKWFEDNYKGNIYHFTDDFEIDLLNCIFDPEIKSKHYI